MSSDVPPDPLVAAIEARGKAADPWIGRTIDRRFLIEARIQPDDAGDLLPLPASGGRARRRRAPSGLDDFGAP